MKKVLYAMLCASVSLIACQKTDSLSNSNNSTSSFSGTWYLKHESSVSTNYIGNTNTTGYDTIYSTNENIIVFKTSDSATLTNSDGIVNCYYKVLSNNEIKIDFSETNPYLIDTFYYTISGSNLTMWYNRSILYHGSQPVATLFNGSYANQYNPLDSNTYYTAQSDTLNLIKQ
jgi:hypothetical protein